MARPQFIVIEGLDGSGKSTQIEMLKDRLQGRGEACWLTAEPTELPTGRFIRSILRGDVSADPRTVAALYAADRIEHLHHPSEGVLAQLAAGYHVISSRYYFSSLAYQAEYADPGWVASLNLYAKRTLPADLTIFLDLSPEQSMERIESRGAEKEMFENLEKLAHVRESFQLAFEYFGEGENIWVIDASGDPVEVADLIWEAYLGLGE
ncbi:dTMP kinase [Neolewinella lacunae]|uniref:Thymidylate kinase n=1 Tax=Neolewinella lacunae TaxID=1517758 RepID=A0A923PRN9_9BACT|nr:dTMP kinase [Neolewinella lacunae]MBC6996228.1 dTMP kinase [Neolewinella lacunae]MDN3634752.1 dTMP kinase [Neolewinella lacunae]